MKTLKSRLGSLGLATLITGLFVMVGFSSGRAQTTNAARSKPASTGAVEQRANIGAFYTVEDGRRSERTKGMK